MRHPKELDSDDLRDIANTVCDNLIKKLGVPATIFLRSNNDLVSELLKQTYLAIRIKLEEKHDQ